jgi:drug/metabolite transporter (DMT)-like permease
MPAAQLILVRGLMASAIVLLIAFATGARLRRADLTDRRVLLRAAIDAVSTFGYLLSLFHLPIANAAAINMAAPLFVVALAVPLFNERVDGLRWVAVGAGFAGVLLIVRPSLEGFNAWSLLCLGATLLHAFRDLLTRRIPARIPSLSITLATALCTTLLASAITAPQGWQAMSARELALIAGAALCLSGGYLLITMSARAGDISAVAPWRYTGMLWAILLGWLLWRELPDALAWGGIALLVAAGLYLMRRERGR